MKTQGNADKRPAPRFDLKKSRKNSEATMRYILLSIMVISMSGCSAVETSTQLYQLCKYQNKCPVEVLGDWLHGK